MFDEFDFENYFNEQGKIVLRLCIAETFYEVLVNFGEDIKQETDYFCNLSDLPQLIKLMLFTERPFKGTQVMTANIIKCGTHKQIIRTVYLSFVEVSPDDDYKYYPLFPALESNEKFKYVKRYESKTLRFDTF